MKDFLVIYDSKTGNAEVDEFDSYEVATDAYKKMLDKFAGDQYKEVHLIGAKDLKSLKASYGSLFHGG